MTKWRVVHAKIATLQEVETHYDINDLWDANMMLDLHQAAEERSAEKAKRVCHGR